MGKRGGGLAVLAYSVASAADDVYGLLEMGRKEKMRCVGGDIPVGEEWLGLYRDHRVVRRGMNEVLMPMIMGYSDAGEDYNALQDELGSWRRITAEEFISDWEALEPEEQKEVVEWGQDLALALKEDALELPEGEPERPEDLEAGDIFVPEVQFAIWVWLPCWYETKRAPVQVLRDARQGDMDALETLLRIDKAVVGDSRISAQLHRAEMSNPAQFQRLADAFRGKPNEKLTKRKVKYSLAGIISRVSEGLQQRLNSREIRNLFDAIARDEKGQNIDPDLPASLSTFSRAIRRERDVWHFLPVGLRAEMHRQGVKD